MTLLYKICNNFKYYSKGVKIITDVELAKRLDINPRTLADWKKGRVKIYNRLKWSYEAEHLLKEIELNNDDIQVRVKRVVGKQTDKNLSTIADSKDNYDLLIKQYQEAYIKHYTEYTAETDRHLMDAANSFIDGLDEDSKLYDNVSSYIHALSDLYSPNSSSNKRAKETMQHKENDVMFRLNVIVTYIRSNS